MKCLYRCTVHTTTIHHIIALPSSTSLSNVTLFQGFSRELVDNYYWTLRLLAVLPHDALELFINKQQFAASKMIGSSLDVFMIKAELLNASGIDFNRVFTIIYSTSETDDQVSEFIGQFKYKPIVISASQAYDTVAIGKNTEREVVDRLKLRIKEIQESDPKSDLAHIGLQLAKNNTRSEQVEKLDIPVLGHNCVRPLIQTLNAYGFKDYETEPVIPQNQNKSYVDGMLSLVGVIDNERSLAIAQLQVPIGAIKNDCIVYCPSIYGHLYSTESEFWRGVLPKMSKLYRDFIKKTVIRSRNYSNTTFELSEDFQNIYQSGTPGLLLLERQRELTIFTQIISILAVNQFVPAIRLPSDVMLHHNILKDISVLIRGGGHKKHAKLNKKIKEYSALLKNEIGERLVDGVFTNRTKLLAVCDFPIEWFGVNGVPLMFTHEISRIGTTPGNMLVQLALSGQRIMLPCRAVRKILIIRSFAANDPIKDFLSIALERFADDGNYNNIEIERCDVSSVVEAKEKLNKFDGAVVIFDCHGNHGGPTENGWLNIGNDKMDVWQLGRECRIPPIVMLSACSTHAIDGSHASVANGFLSKGCLAVLGTYAPINAIHSAQFVARILHRISNFLHLAASHSPISWRTFISGFLKMSYTTDVLKGLMEREKLINEEQYRRIHIDVNMAINSGKIDWHSQLVNQVAECTKTETSNIANIIAENYQFIDSMLYSQLGRPENIILYDDQRQADDGD